VARYEVLYRDILEMFKEIQKSPFKIVGDPAEMRTIQQIK
jgi:Txe/YoeB family toxin of Txe-Axe toxin-antitoxin module